MLPSHSVAATSTSPVSQPYCSATVSTGGTCSSRTPFWPKRRRTRDRCAMCERAVEYLRSVSVTTYPAADRHSGSLTHRRERDDQNLQTATGHRLVAVAATRPRAGQSLCGPAWDRTGGRFVRRADLRSGGGRRLQTRYPTACHGPWNLAAVRAGKHVLTEKTVFEQRGGSACCSRGSARERSDAARGVPLPLSSGEPAPAGCGSERHSRRGHSGGKP